MNGVEMDGSRGWIKSWRKTEESWVWQNPEIFHLWMLCLYMANHKAVEVTWGQVMVPIHLEPGQFVTGRKSLHSRLYPKTTETTPCERTVWNWMRLLEKAKNLVIKSASNFSIVTICNWNTYQGDDQENCQANCQPLANPLPSPCQPSATAKNDKNDKNDKNEENTTLSPSAPGKKFIQPSLEEITVYCRERNNGIDPQSFIDHYSANGWKVGRNPMKDWRAAVRTWERNRKNKEPEDNYTQTPEQEANSIALEGKIERGEV